MSFILDALKKSENDRQRQSGPALFEVRVAPPRSKLPLLAIAIVSLLVVNLGVVGWIMLRKPADAAVPPVQAAAAAPSALGPQQAFPAAPSGAPQASPGSGQATAANVPPGQYGAAPNSGAYAPNGNSAPPPQSGFPPAAANGGYPAAGSPGRTPAQEPMLSDGAQQPSQGANPDDYVPAREAGPPGADAGHTTRGTESGLPSYEEAATHASIPPLHMDLHSYAPDPAKRFVLINMKRLYEGQSLPEGPKVESITNDAAIMSFQGTRFVLDKD